MSPMPASMRVAADTLAVRIAGRCELEVLLVERRNPPYRGSWAIPGGFVELDEDLADAAARELLEETSLTPVAVDQVGAWGRPGRDPRGRTVSAVYVAVARPGEDQVRGGDDAARAQWHPVSALPHLAFDHDEIVPAAIAHLRRRCELTHLALGLLPDPFAAEALERALAALGSLAPAEDARRLIAAADVDVIDGCAEARRFRFTGNDVRRPLREPVTMFPTR